MLKGKTEIILTDTRTGEVERHFDENMVTGALSSFYKDDPYGLTNLNAQGNQASTTATGSVTIPRDYLNGLDITSSGVLCFPQTLEEDTEHIFEALTHQPTGYSSNDSYTGEDTKRGGYSVPESGYIKDTEGKIIGYRHVFDFATSQGNGVISAVALTHRRGGLGYSNNYEAILNGAAVWSGSASNHTIGLASIESAGAAYYPLYVLAYNDEFVTFLCSDKKARKIQIQPKKLNFGILRQQGFNMDDPETGAVEVYSQPTGNWMYITDGDSFYRCQSSGNSITWVKYDINGAQIGSGTWSASGASFLTTADLNHTSIVNGYLYYPNNAATGFYKMNISNTADVELVDCGTISRSYAKDWGREIGGEFWHTRGIISGSTNYPSSRPITNIPFRRIGVHVLMLANIYDSYKTMILGVATQCNYLATINNLSQPVTKDSSRTMKIIYTLTEA